MMPLRIHPAHRTETAWADEGQNGAGYVSMDVDAFVIVTDNIMHIHDETSQAAIMTILGGYWLSQAVYIAARLKIADAVGESSATLGEIIWRTGIHPKALGRVMCDLTCPGFSRRMTGGLFADSFFRGSESSDAR
jgi:hypothetical protein